MKTEDLKLWNTITFKTQSYRKNFDMINDNENFITECDGTISEVRLLKRKPPLHIGEYGFSIWNIELGNQFSVDFNKLITEHSFENSYKELIGLIKNKKIDIQKYKKILIIHSLVINKKYRKHEIVEEFIEMIYRDYYDKNVAIIFLVKPFQNNPIDYDFYIKRKHIFIRDSVLNNDGTNVSAAEYYSLQEFLDKKDTELNEYKLFAIATRCGFKRIDESHLFIFSPEKINKRLVEKKKILETLETK